MNEVHASGILGILVVSLLIFGQVRSIPDCFDTSSTTITCNNIRITDQEVYTGSGPTENVKSIEIKNSRVDSPDFFEFVKYTTALEQLYLANVTGITNLHLDRYIKNLKALKILSIRDMPNIDSLAFLILDRQGGTYNLERLEIVKCGLTGDIGEDLFTPDRTTLEQIDLSQNKIKTISFPNSMSSMTQLDLSYNTINTLSGISGMPALTDLDLKRNELTDSQFINSLPLSLTTLDVSYNKLTILELSPLSSNQRYLREVRMEMNRLVSISGLSGSIMDGVTQLNLRNNNLGSTNAQFSFSGLQALTDLNLQSNEIRQIDNQLQNLRNLRNLQLQNNLLSSLPLDVFQGTTQIQDLELHDNRLTDVDFLSKGRAELSNLKSVDVSNNLLNQLENFGSAPGLRTLRMNDNSFEDLSRCSLGVVPRTLEVICALNVSPSNQCPFDTVLKMFEDNQILYNNDQCCNDKEHLCCKQPERPECSSNYPVEYCSDVGDLNKICTTNPVRPGRTTVDPGPGATNGNRDRVEERKPFTELTVGEQIVLALGFVLAALFLIILLFICLRRTRNYKQWHKDFKEQATENGNGTFQDSQGPVSYPYDLEIDEVDGPGFRRNTPASGTMRTMQSTLNRMPNKSFDNISLASGISGRSTGSKQMFGGRNKFKDAQRSPQNFDNIYAPTRPVQRHGSGSTTYSYASINELMRADGQRRRRSSETFPQLDLIAPHRPYDFDPSGRRRHKSGGSIPSRATQISPIHEHPWPVRSPHSAGDLLSEALGMPSGAPRYPDQEPVPIFVRKPTDRRKGDSPKPGESGSLLKASGSPNSKKRKRGSPVNGRSLPKTPSSAGDRSIHSLKSMSSAASSSSGTLFSKNNPDFKFDGKSEKPRKKGQEWDRNVVDNLPMDHYVTDPTH